jgi:hypothetical protein
LTGCWCFCCLLCVVCFPASSCEVSVVCVPLCWSLFFSVMDEHSNRVLLLLHSRGASVFRRPPGSATSQPSPTKAISCLPACGPCCGGRFPLGGDPSILNVLVKGFPTHPSLCAPPKMTRWPVPALNRPRTTTQPLPPPLPGAEQLQLIARGAVGAGGT